MASTLGLALLALATGGSGAALAQATLQPFPGQAEPGRNVPPPAPGFMPQFNFSIPAPQRGPVPRAVDVIEFDVKQIKITGNKVFPESAFKPLTDTVVGKHVKLSDIIDVADKIEAMYRTAGFVLTRAYVPPQTVSNGIFQINVVEGYVKATAVNGGSDNAREQVDEYLQPITQERPATLDSLERGLLLANDLPGISAAGLLRPSPTEPGASDLVVTVNQVPWEATIYSDNRGAEITGAVTLGYQAILNEIPLISQWVPGQFLIDISGTPDLSQRRLIQTRYAQAIGASGLQASLNGVFAQGVPSAAGGNLVSNSNSVGARLTYPIIVTRPTRVTVEGGLTWQEAKEQAAGAVATALAGLVSPVYSDDSWRDLDVALTLQQRDLINGSTTGATFGITQGLPILGASSTNPFNQETGSTAAQGGSTGFTKFTLVAQHDQPIWGPVSANFHGLGQYTGERLVVGEQTSFGGSGIGRGYDPAAIAGDIGVGIASELRYEMHLPQYKVDTLQFYYFFDAAKVRPLHDETVVLSPGVVNNRSILSTGFGVRAALLQTVTGGIEFAQELRGVPDNDNGKTGARILFNAAVRF